jgi:hypothetical protein
VSTFGGTPDPFGSGSGSGPGSGPASGPGSYFGSLPAQPTAPQQMPAFGAPPYSGPGPFSSGSPYSAPPPPTRRRMTAGRVVLIALAVLGVLAVVGAVEGPRMRDQAARDVADRTTMSLPPSIDARHMLTDAASKATVQKLVASQRLPAQGAIYQAPGAADRMVVVMQAHPWSPTQQDQFIAGLKSAMTFDLQDVDPGRLGGHAMCGTQTSGGALVTACVYVDAAGSIQVIVVGSGTVARSEAMSAREQVEVRT